MDLYYPRGLHSEIEARLQRLTISRRRGRRAVRSGDADETSGRRH